MVDIVLVEPEIPNNTGAIARTCACTACRLHLVGPMAFAIDDKKLKHAGLDYWHYLDITYYDGLEDFFAKNSGPDLTTGIWSISRCMRTSTSTSPKMVMKISGCSRQRQR